MNLYQSHDFVPKAIPSCRHLYTSI